MQVVERLVAVPIERVRLPRHGEWTDVLSELARQLDTERIYARDLPALEAALDGVLAACRRRARRR